MLQEQRNKPMRIQFMLHHTEQGIIRTIVLQHAFIARYDDRLVYLSLMKVQKHLPIFGLVYAYLLLARGVDSGVETLQQRIHVLHQCGVPVSATRIDEQSKDSRGHALQSLRARLGLQQ